MESPKRTEQIGGRELHLSSMFRKAFELRVNYENGWSEGHLNANPQKYEIYQMFMRTIDFDRVWSIFEKEIIKAGVDVTRLNKIPVSQFGIRNLEEGAMANFGPDTNRIAVGDEFLEHLIKNIENEGTPTVELAVEFILTMVHEMLHAVGRIYIKSFVGDAGKIQLERRVGYSRHIQTPGSARLLQFDGFNEAVTEGMAMEITLGYLKSKGSVPGLLKKNIIQTLDPRKGQRYAMYVGQLQVIIERISAHEQLPERDVWNAIKHGYFSGEWLLSKHNRELMDGVFGEGFTKEYAKITEESSGDEVIDFNAKYGISFDDSTMNRWLENLGIEESYPLEK